MRLAGARTPLAGLAVAVTRPEGASGRLSLLLRGLGADVLTWPAVEIAPPEDATPLEQALARIESYDWIAFTSPRAVDAVVSRCESRPRKPRVAAIGKATAAALEAASWPVALTAPGPGASSLVDSLERLGVDGARVLCPASSRARDVLRRGLLNLGADVDQPVAYRTMLAKVDAAECHRRLAEGSVAAITFASPSSVNGLLESVGPELFQKMLHETACVAIGPTTAQALVAAGSPGPVTASRATLSSLAEAVVAAVAPRPA